MIIFFTIVLSLYSLVNYYIFIRGFQSLPANKWVKSAYIVLFLFFALSYIIGRILERYECGGIAEFFTYIGSFWFAAILYFFLAVLLIDLFRAINHFFPIIPEILSANMQKAKFITFLSVVFLTIIILFAGYINASKPVVKEINVRINKKVKNLKTLRIAVASDIHIGNIINKKRIEKLVQDIQSLHPDIVLFPGDILDEDVAPVIKKAIGESLKDLKAKYGLWAITGNHEYIGGVNSAVKYINSLGIKMLRDGFILIDDKFYVVGREDRSGERFKGEKREELGEIMTGIDRNKPIILMDHQPFKLNEATEQDVDLQLSGHTHHGQLWPLNFITNLVYELSWGYLKKHNTHFYVSSGYGTWGPPVRTGNYPEIVLITVIFD